MPTPTSDKESSKKPTKDSLKDSAKASAKGHSKEYTKDSFKGSTKDSAKDSTKGSTEDSANDSIMDTYKKSAREVSLERFEKPSEHSSNANGENPDKGLTKTTGHLSGESSTKDSSKTNGEKTENQSTGGSERFPGDSSTKDSTKADSNGPLVSHISSLAKSGLTRVGHYFHASSGDADSEESIRGDGPEPRPNDKKHSRACKYSHGHPPGSSPDAVSEGHVCVLDPEPMTEESGATREKQKKVADHTGQDEVIGVIHPADCEEHPDAKAEHLVADNPRLGKMIAVYQKIEAKQKEVMEKLSKSEEDKERKERVKQEKQEAKEKKHRERHERREQRAREKQERAERRAQEKQERAKRAAEKRESLGTTGGTDGTTDLLPTIMMLNTMSTVTCATSQSCPCPSQSCPR
ncbi:hypothetical protein PG996_010143 [Apiospora saccharicola]|uniref:Uncharacterized protein n=1 Tax=Apiospora saccharicola TaxID=335842 RepID=A0ABR1UQS3_9PEZI